MKILFKQNKITPSIRNRRNFQLSVPKDAPFNKTKFKILFTTDSASKLNEKHIRTYLKQATKRESITILNNYH